MKTERYDRETLEFFLKGQDFQGLTVEYMLECYFDEELQKAWKPKLGDAIIGPTGNIFVIAAVEQLSQTLGGTRYYFAPGSCNRDGGVVLNETYSHTANESGLYYDPLMGQRPNRYHTSIRKFKYIPYPHLR